MGRGRKGKRRRHWLEGHVIVIYARSDPDADNIRRALIGLEHVSRYRFDGAKKSKLDEDCEVARLTRVIVSASGKGRRRSRQRDED